MLHVSDLMREMKCECFCWNCAHNSLHQESFYKMDCPFSDLWRNYLNANECGLGHSMDSNEQSLKLLEEKDMYGYEMIDTLRGKSKNVFELKAGTLYPLLHGLEEKEFVKSYEQEAGGKTRKYYSITREGKKQLRAKEKEWKEYAGAVRNVLGGVCFG